MTSEQQTSLKDAVDLFILDGEARRLRPRTLDYYQWQLDRLLAYLRAQNCETLQAITPALLRAYLVHLQTEGWRDNSQHAAARAMRAWLNFCVREDLLPASPMRKVRMPRLDKKILPALSEDDLDRLLATAEQGRYPERDKAMLLCLLDTGARVAEFTKLTVGDVDTKRGTVMILAGKGGKDRQVYIGARARKALIRYLLTRHKPLATDALWLSETGDGLTVYGVQTWLVRLGRAADVQHCSAHSFRRACALMLHRNGARLTEIAALLGHSDLSTLRKYLALEDQDAEAAHRAHGPVDHLDTKGR